MRPACVWCGACVRPLASYSAALTRSVHTQRRHSGDSTCVTHNNAISWRAGGRADRLAGCGACRLPFSGWLLAVVKVNWPVRNGMCLCGIVAECKNAQRYQRIGPSPVNTTRKNALAVADTAKLCGRMRNACTRNCACEHAKDEHTKKHISTWHFPAASRVICEQLCASRDNTHTNCAGRNIFIWGCMFVCALTCDGITCSHARSDCARYYVI